MSRNIPILLETHLSGNVHTVCYAMKVTPVGANAPAVFGVVGLDYSIEYDDGDGLIEYSNAGGLVPSAIRSSSDLGVDNGEAEVLIPGFSVPPMTKELIRAGRYDYAKFVLYLLNYKDLTAGSGMIEMTGTLGRVSVVNGLACFPELRGASQIFRQSVCEQDSFTCRNKFGDDICGIDLDPLWQESEISVVGAEFDRTFRLIDITPPTQGFAPGMVEFLDGANMGRSYEVESWTDIGSGVIEVSLAHATDYPNEVGDLVKIRPDCDKRFRETCIPVYDNLLQFNGEPDIPIGDEGAMAIPGAIVGPGSGLGGSPGVVEETL